MERILVACDFHGECRKAMEKAAGLTSKTSFIYILYPVPSKMDRNTYKNLKKTVREKVKQIKSQGFKCRGAVKIGEPASKIAKTAKRLRCNLIIMDYLEEGIFSQYSMEDILQKVMDLSSLPVMIVH
ncbi:MAG: universal stress protein [Candidatus Thermoplasmatota archaeon]|nr:universal stress protein [Candidatus Thermoplasmatota archaeon]